MDIRQQIYKALHLMDNNREAEALKLFIDLNKQAKETNSFANIVRTSVIIGDIYFQKGLLTEAEIYLEEALLQKDKNPDFVDVLQYEFDNASILLSKMKTKKFPPL